MTTNKSLKNFIEVCIYEVKSDKEKEFETLIKNVLKHHSKFSGVVDVRYMKRTHRSVDFSGAKTGKPAIKLTRIQDTITYILYWELKDKIAHAKATKSGLKNFFKEFRRCLAMPPKIILGERIE